MTNTIALLDKARALCSPPTDYQLAKRLGISTATITRCRRHRGTLDNKAAWKLAALLKMQPAEVIAYMEEDRAKARQDAEDVAFWRSQLATLATRRSLSRSAAATAAA